MHALTDDLRDALANLRFWWFLAWLEIRQRYRRSVLGPLWITLTTAIQISILLFVFTSLFGTNENEYVSWITYGSIAWSFVNGSLQEATSSLIKRASFLKERQVSHIGLVTADIFKQVLLLMHLVPIYVVLILLIRHPPTVYLLALLFSVPLLVLAFIPINLLIAYAAVRYRDVPPLVMTATSSLYFLTPILWRPEQIGAHAWIVAYNPIASAVAMIRQPLRGEPIAGSDILKVVAVAAIAWGVAALVQSRYRRRIVYWV